MKADGNRPVPQNVVASLEDALAARRRPALVLTGAEPHAVDQLLRAMHLVKAARFNAAERLERKQTVSTFTLSVVALYFVGLSVWQAVYAGHIDEATTRHVNLIEIVSSVFALMLGLLEALNNYQMKAHHLHNCALAVSDIAQELRLARTAPVAALQDFRRRYNEALRACPVNHSRIDYVFAKLETSKDASQWTMARIRYLFDVYALYAAFLLAPPLLWRVLS